MHPPLSHRSCHLLTSDLEGRPQVPSQMSWSDTYTKPWNSGMTSWHNGKTHSCANMYPLQISKGLAGKGTLLKRIGPKKDLKNSKTSDFPPAWKNDCSLLFWNWISLKNTLKTKQNWQSSDWLRFVFCSQQSVFAPLPWKRRIIYSWAASHLPSLFLTKQQRK